MLQLSLLKNCSDAIKPVARVGNVKGFILFQKVLVAYYEVTVPYYSHYTTESSLENLRKQENIERKQKREREKKKRER